MTRTYHIAHVQVGRRYYRAVCVDCDFGHAARTDKTSGRHSTRDAARDAAHAHMLFTHATGGRRCGRDGCTVDRIIARMR